MLRVNQFTAFGGGISRALPSLRHVGTYGLTFSASETASVNIPGADLGPAHSYKQLFFLVGVETSSINKAGTNGSGMTFGGAAVTVFNGFYQGATGGCTAGAIAFTGSGDQTFAIDCGASVTETTSVVVYEVIDAAPLEWATVYTEAPAASVAVSYRVPVGAVILAWALNATDTATFTWTGLTETIDADVGASRLGFAVNATPAAAASDATVTCAGSAGTVFPCVMVIRGRSHYGPRIVPNHGAGASPSASTQYTFQAAVHPSQVPAKLIIAVCDEVNPTITAITLGGTSILANQIGQVVNSAASPDLKITLFEVDVDASNVPGGELVITYSGSISGSVGGVITYLLYEATVGTPVTATGSGTTAATNVNIDDDGGVIVFHVNATAGASVAWAGASECMDASNTNYRQSAAHRADMAAEVARAITATIASNQWAQIALPINRA